MKMVTMTTITPRLVMRPLSLFTEWKAPEQQMIKPTFEFIAEFPSQSQLL